jgi:hypothetical protein
MSNKAGYNAMCIIERMYEALNILQKAVPNGATKCGATAALDMKYIDLAIQTDHTLLHAACTGRIQSKLASITSATIHGQQHKAHRISAGWYREFSGTQGGSI